MSLKVQYHMAHRIAVLQSLQHPDRSGPRSSPNTDKVGVKWGSKQHELRRGFHDEEEAKRKSQIKVADTGQMEMRNLGFTISVLLLIYVLCSCGPSKPTHVRPEPQASSQDLQTNEGFERLVQQSLPAVVLLLNYRPDGKIGYGRFRGFVYRD